MDNVIRLLQEKNQHLEAFLKLNEVELVNFCEGNFDNLENFYQSREGLLAIIDKLDRLIDESHQLNDVETVSDTEKARALNALNKKNELVGEILSQDLQILSVIENVKSGIIKELAQVRATRKAFKSYKTGKAKNSMHEEA